MVGHDEFIELLGAYALDAIDADERRSIEAHLDGCEACQAEVDEHLEVASALGATIASPMPAGLWDRIAVQLDAGPIDDDGEPLRLPRLAVLDAHETPQVAADRTSRATASSAGAPDAPEATGATVATLDEARRSRRPGRIAAGLVAAAAAIVLVVVGLAWANTNRRADDLAAQLRDQGSILARPPAELAAERALADPANTVYDLTSESSDARARAVVTPNGDGFLVPDSMTSLAPDRTYQLWVVGDAGPVSLGVMGNEPGVTAFHVQGPPPLLAITDETAGGVTSPQGKPLLTGKA